MTPTIRDSKRLKLYGKLRQVDHAAAADHMERTGELPPVTRGQFVRSEETEVMTRRAWPFEQERP
jgi:hypothetical protein